MFAALIIPAAESGPEHIDFRGGTMLEETAFFYDVDIDGDSENSRSAGCEHRTPAGGLGYWIDDEVAARNKQSAARFENPPDELQMFVQQCYDNTESGETVIPFNRMHLSSQRLLKTYAARFRWHGDTP